MTKQFRRELQELINSHSIDAKLSLPDYIIAGWLCSQLKLLNDDIFARLTEDLKEKRK